MTSNQRGKTYIWIINHLTKWICSLLLWMMETLGWRWILASCNCTMKGSGRAKIVTKGRRINLYRSTQILMRLLTLIDLRNLVQTPKHFNKLLKKLSSSSKITTIRVKFLIQTFRFITISETCQASTFWMTWETKDLAALATPSVSCRLWTPDSRSNMAKRLKTSLRNKCWTATSWLKVAPVDGLI